MDKLEKLAHDEVPSIAPCAGDIIFAIVVGLVVGLLYCVIARAEVPPARNANECGIVAEMALTARTLDKHGIGGEKAQAMMDDFYSILLASEHAERVAAYLAATLKLGARDDMRALEPATIADLVAMTCARSSGDLTVIFGTDS